MNRHVASFALILPLAACIPALRARPAGAVACPAGGAQIEVCIKNPTSSTGFVLNAAGTYITNEITCTGGSVQSSYNQQITITWSNGATVCTPISVPLLTGMFRHNISSSSGSYWQYQQGPVLFAPSLQPKTKVSWVYHAMAIKVNKVVASDSDDALCPGDICADTDCPVNDVSSPAACTLRKAIYRANQESSSQTPVVINFLVSPGTMFKTNPLRLAGGGWITIDAVESNGNPWIVGDPSAAAAGNQDPFGCVVDLNDKTRFDFASSNNTIQGLRIKNTLPSPTFTQTKNLITSAAGTVNNRVQAVKIEGGNTLSCNPNCGQLNFSLFEVLGGTLANPSTIIQNVQGHSAIDKGVKANTGAGTVKDSWFHHNYRGGIQATLNGKIRAERNMVEKAGRRVSDDQMVDNGANGMSSNGGTSTLETDANISRVHINNGIAVRESGSPVLTARNDYACGNSQQGIAVSDGAIADVAGAAGVYNSSRGAQVDAGTTGSVNFGNPGPTPGQGNNAFARSGSSCDFRNNSSTVVNVARNQWGPSGTPRVCQTPGTVVTSPVQDYLDSQIVLDQSVPTIPSNVLLKGQTIRARGEGFNAVNGNPAIDAGCAVGNPNPPAKSCCLTRPQAANVCGSGINNPLLGMGNCVELQDASGSWQKLTVTSVTPTTIVTEIPDTMFGCCGSDATINVSKRGSGGALIQNSKPYCTNVAPKDSL